MVRRKILMIMIFAGIEKPGSLSIRTSNKKALKRIVSLGMNVQFVQTLPCLLIFKCIRQKSIDFSDTVD